MAFPVYIRVTTRVFTNDAMSGDLLMKVVHVEVSQQVKVRPSRCPLLSMRMLNIFLKNFSRM